MLASRDDTIELYQERLKVANGRIEAMNTEVRNIKKPIKQKSMSKLEEAKERYRKRSMLSSVAG